MTRSEIANQLQASGLLDEIARELHEIYFARFVDAVRECDDQGENPVEHAIAAARRCEAVDDVVARFVDLIVREK